MKNCFGKFLAVLVVTIVLTATLVQGAVREGILSITGWWERQSVVQTLGLTYEQISRIQKIHDQNYAKTRGLRTELKRQSMEISNLLEQDVLDEAKISVTTDKIATIVSDIDKADITMRVAAIKELSAEQRKKLKTLTKR